MKGRETETKREKKHVAVKMKRQEGGGPKTIGRMEKMQKRAKDTRRESEVGETSGGNREAGAELGEAEAWAATGGKGRGRGWTLGLPEVLVGDAKESEGDWPCG